MSNKSLGLLLSLTTLTFSLQIHEGPLKISAPPPKTESQTASMTEPLIIAIIDTGIDTAHPSLKDYLWTNPGESGMDSRGFDKATNGIDDDGNGFIDDIHGWNFADLTEDLDDEHGHGTHIAGIIQQEILRYENSERQSKRKIRFMILKYYSSKSNGSKNLENSNAALGYAIKMGAHIANYSGGGRTPHPVEESLILEALEKNILIVAAAGNEAINTDKTPFYPASYGLPHIFSVGGLSEKQSLAFFSNYGANSVDILAQGEHVLSSLPQKKFGPMTGTSQATAFVTAALAIFIASQEEALSPLEIRQQLFATAAVKNELSLTNRSGGALDTEAFLQSRTNHQTAQDYRQANSYFISTEDLFDSRPDLQLRLAEFLPAPL